MLNSEQMTAEQALRKDGTLRSKFRQRFDLMAKLVAKSERDTKRAKNSEEARNACFFDYSLWIADITGDHTVAAAIDHPCGTQACVGGWAAILRAAEEGHDNVKLGDMGEKLYLQGTKGYQYAGEWLGLYGYAQQTLIFDGRWHLKRTDASNSAVIKMLKQVAATGRLPNKLGLPNKLEVEA